MAGTPYVTPPSPTNPLGQLPVTGELKLVGGVLNRWNGRDWERAVIPTAQLDAQPVYKDPATGEVTLSNGLIVAGGVTADALTVSGNLHANGPLVAADGASVIGGLTADAVTATGAVQGASVTATGTVRGNAVTSTGDVTAGGNISGSGTLTVSSDIHSSAGTISADNGDIVVNGWSLPRGWHGGTFLAANTGGITNTGTILLQLGTSFQLVNGRRYKVTGKGWGVGSTVANTDYYDVVLHDLVAGADLDTWRGWCGPAAGGAYSSWYLQAFLLGDGVTHTFQLLISRVVGTGTLTQFAGSARPVILDIEDVGGI